MSTLSVNAFWRAKICARTQALSNVLCSAIAPHTSISKFPEEDLTELFVTLRSFYAVTFGPEDLEPLDQL